MGFHGRSHHVHRTHYIVQLTAPANRVLPTAHLVGIGVVIRNIRGDLQVIIPMVPL